MAVQAINRCGVSAESAKKYGARCASAGTKLVPNWLQIGSRGCCRGEMYVNGHGTPAHANSSVDRCLQSLCKLRSLHPGRLSNISTLLRPTAGKFAGSGMFGIALADTVCAGGSIDLYGFATSRDCNISSSYHYFETCRRRVDRDEPLSRSAQQLEELAANFSRFRLRTAEATGFGPLNLSLTQRRVCNDGLPIMCGLDRCPDLKHPKSKTSAAGVTGAAKATGMAAARYHAYEHRTTRGAAGASLRANYSARTGAATATEMAPARYHAYERGSAAGASSRGNYSARTEALSSSVPGVEIAGLHRTATIAHLDRGSIGNGS